MKPLFLLLFFLLDISYFTIDRAVAGDELLAIVQSEQVSRLHEAVGCRLYQRLGDHALIGLTNREAQRAISTGVTMVPVDDRPWSSAYAVISDRQKRLRQDQLTREGLQVLFVADDLFLVKGPASLFDELSLRGWSVVPVPPNDLWRNPQAVHLPGRILQPSEEINLILSHIADSMITSSIQDLQDFGTRYYMNANRDSISGWLRNEFFSFGFTDVVLDSFQYNGTWQKNVVATLPGSSSKELIIGAHHDSYSSNLSAAPGADDNATGTAAVLEMARVLKEMNYQPSLTLRFITFAAEEAGLRGSASYAQRARQQNRDITVMMNYDMLGYRNQSSSDRDFYIVWYPGSEAFSDLHAAAASMYTTLTPVMTSSYRGSSDSYPFYQQGYSAVFCIERDFSPYYHSPNDLLQYLEIPYAKEIVRAGMAMLLILDELPPAVDGFSLRDRGDGSSLFASWDDAAIPDVREYRVYVGQLPFLYDTSYVVSGTSTMVPNLIEGRQYFVGVAGIDLTGREGLIAEKTAVPWMVPLPPRSLTASPPWSRLDWRPGDEVDLLGYHVYRSLDSSQSFIRLTFEPVQDTTYTDSTSGQTLRSYFVTAVDSTAHESQPSDTIEVSPTVSVERTGFSVPSIFRLHQNFPNPFNPETEISYEIQTKAYIELIVTDFLGRLVTTLVNKEQAPGFYRIRWDGSASSTGVYFCTLKSGSKMQTIRMMLLR